MGGDCCGGESLPAAQHALNDLHLNTLENDGAAQPAPQQTHEQCAKELEDFIKKRIQLFEQYYTRETAVVRLSSYTSHMTPFCLASIICVNP
jgi:U3 small nucleolar ribonucleoprotein component